MTKTDKGTAAMTITTEELRKLMEDVTQGDWHVDGRMIAPNPCVSICAMVELDSFGGKNDAPNWQNNARLIALAPYLARRVLAADTMVVALKKYMYTELQAMDVMSALREYEETK